MRTRDKLSSVLNLAEAYRLTLANLQVLQISRPGEIANS